MAITGGTYQATGYVYRTRGELSITEDASTGEEWTKTYNLLGQVTQTTERSRGPFRRPARSFSLGSASRTSAGSSPEGQLNDVIVAPGGEQQADRRQVVLRITHLVVNDVHIEAELARPALFRHLPDVEVPGCRLLDLLEKYRDVTPGNLANSLLANFRPRMYLRSALENP